MNNNTKEFVKIIKFFNKKYKTIIFDSRRFLDKKKYKNYFGTSLTNIIKN